MMTDQLSGPMLDRWVAHAFGWKEHTANGDLLWITNSGVGARRWRLQKDWCPSFDWSQGGPIIQAEYAFIDFMLSKWFGTRWNAFNSIVAEDLLLWMMRAFVASIYGDEVPDDGNPPTLSPQPETVSEKNA